MMSMNYVEKLDTMIRFYGISVRKLADLIGMPSSTVFMLLGGQNKHVRSIRNKALIDAAYEKYESDVKEV